MRRALGMCAVVLTIGVVCAGAQSTTSLADYVGTWAGTWEGGGASGGFVLTLEKAEGDKLGGRVSVTGEPTYEARLKTVAFEGKKMTATYDFTPDPQIAITLTATFDSNSATGAWSARPNGAGADAASGSWTVKRK